MRVYPPRPKGNKVPKIGKPAVAPIPPSDEAELSMLAIMRKSARQLDADADNARALFNAFMARVQSGDGEALADANAAFRDYLQLRDKAMSAAQAQAPYDHVKAQAGDPSAAASPSPIQQHDHARTVRAVADAFDPLSSARDAMDAYMSLLDSSDTASNAEVVEELLQRHAATPHSALVEAVARRRRGNTVPRAAPIPLAVDAATVEDGGEGDTSPSPQPAPVSGAPRPAPSPSPPATSGLTAYDAPPRVKRTENQSRDTSPPPRGESIWDWASRPAAGHADTYRSPRPTSTSPGPATDTYALWQATHGDGGK